MLKEMKWSMHCSVLTSPTSQRVRLRSSFTTSCSLKTRPPLGVVDSRAATHGRPLALQRDNDNDRISVDPDALEGSRRASVSLLLLLLLPSH